MIKKEKLTPTSTKPNACDRTPAPLNGVNQSQFRSALFAHGERTAVSDALSLAANVGKHFKDDMKSRLLSLFSVCILSLSGYAQVPPVGYATSYGGNGTDASWSVAVDAQGNTYTGGYFSDTATIGSSTIISSGDLDLSVVKRDQQGNAVWAKSFGWVLQDMAFTITADAAGNSYLAARWFYQITVDGNTVASNNNSKDIGVLKLDADGNVVWFSTFGGSGTDTPNDIAVDANGNVFVTGQFVTNLTFNGQTVTSNGSDDVFVAKLNANGSPAWVSTFGSTFGDIGRGIAVDANGNCYVTGNARGTSTIGSVILNAAGSNYDIFLVKYNSAGVAQWAQNIGGNNSDYAYGLAADAIGNTYMVGNFTASTMIGSTELIANGTLYTDGFVAKFNSSGVAQWANKIGGSSSDAAYGVAADSDGNCYVVGQYGSSITIDGTYLANEGLSDAFITKLDASGNFDWATSIGGTGIDYGYGIAVHHNGNCYVSGFYAEETMVGSTTLTNNGDFDVYLVRYGNAVVTGLEDERIQTQQKEVMGRYNLLGQPIEEEGKGLHVIRYKDGSHQKTMRVYR